MTENFADKFRVKSGRLENWDYSGLGIYFVTICTLNHNNFLGKIGDGKMSFSKKGLLVYKYLINIPIKFTNIKLIDYIIMPNHVHILLKFNRTNFEKSHIESVESNRDAINRVSTKTDKMQLKNPMNIFSLGTVIRWFKAKVTKEVRDKGLFFAWQSKYYDEIISDKEKLEKVKYYIDNNCKNWEKDKLFR